MQRPIDKISAFESQDVQWEKELNLICEVITQSIQDNSAMGRAVPGELEALLLSSAHSRWTLKEGQETERGGELCHSLGKRVLVEVTTGAEDLRNTSIWDGEPGQGRERKGQSNGTNCFQSWVRQVAGAHGAKEGHF